MKRIIIVIMLITSINYVKAQSENRNAIYSTMELDIGNYVGLDLNLNYVFKEKYSFKIGFSEHLRRATNIPDDYSSGLAGIHNLGFDDPYEHNETFKICFGTVSSLNKSGTIRFNFSVGLGYTIIREPGNWEKVNIAFITDNYKWNYINHNTLSIILNPKIEFPLTRYYGLSISPTIQFNQHSAYIG